MLCIYNYSDNALLYLQLSLMILCIYTYQQTFTNYSTGQILYVELELLWLMLSSLAFKTAS